MLEFAGVGEAHGFAVLGGAAADEMAALIEAYFPKADPGVEPFGPYVLVQERTAPEKIGGIILPSETKDYEQVKTAVGRVIALGKYAYHENDGSPWGKGAWCAVGDFVVIPRASDMKWKVKTATGRDAVFRLVQDRFIYSRVTNPRLAMTIEMRAA